MHRLVSSVLVLALLAACGSGGQPGVRDNHTAFQGLAGTQNTPEGVGTRLVHYTESGVVAEVVEITVTGPAGWNGGQPYASTPNRGIQLAYWIDAEPVSGDYQFTTTLDGITYTDTATLDATSLLPMPQNINVTSYTSDTVQAEWDPVPGADTYLAVLVRDSDGNSVRVGFPEAESVVFEDLSLEEGAYYVRVSAHQSAPHRSPEGYVNQRNASQANSATFTIP